MKPAVVVVTEFCRATLPGVILSGVSIRSRMLTKSKDPYEHNRVEGVNRFWTAVDKQVGVLRLLRPFAKRSSGSAQDDSLWIRAWIVTDVRLAS